MALFLSSDQLHSPDASRSRRAAHFDDTERQCDVATLLLDDRQPVPDSYPTTRPRGGMAADAHSHTDTRGHGRTQQTRCKGRAGRTGLLRQFEQLHSTEIPVRPVPAALGSPHTLARARARCARLRPAPVRRRPASRSPPLLSSPLYRLYPSLPLELPRRCSARLRRSGARWNLLPTGLPV